MVYFLLTISFILHGILILIIMVLFKKVKQAEELELRQKQVASEIEEVFNQYLMEIKEENEKMDTWLNHTSTSEADHRPQEPTKTEKPEEQNDEDYSPPLPVQEEAEYVPSLPSRVMTMYNSGMDMEEIARELNLGKTEVELLVKFQHTK
ncbi:DUF6115 domain-containing protein [Halobacillus naozhouensis]|uniref:Swarming motility protein SwrB n=1 Tax=Halobacillus naozhouensis TaxID=554880 RepID=A0ABY8J7M5_9BACI|nr:hypothetical protein [Halobacillus naozhouensis]WFT76760.1 hypothetical protein P9989_10535 [Halobacillus naozhouensis]